MTVVGGRPSAGTTLLVIPQLVAIIRLTQRSKMSGSGTYSRFIESMLENHPPKSILIVEDDETLQQTLAYNLEREGYTVSVAADGQTGLAVARSQPYDLIVLDVMLPQLDGLSVCRILR